MTDAEQFLRSLFGHADAIGYLSFWTVAAPGRGNAQGKLNYHFPVPDGLYRAVEAAERLKDQANVFFGLALRREDLGPFKRGERKQLTSITSMWADIDVKGPGHAATELPPDTHSALELLDASELPEPTMVVDSGGGLHAYWILDHPYVFGDGTIGCRSFQNVVAALQGKLQAAAAEKGWHVDNTADATRVLRIPGTFNYKIPERPRSVRLIIPDDGTRYSYEALAASVGAPTRVGNKPGAGRRPYQSAPPGGTTRQQAPRPFAGGEPQGTLAPVAVPSAPTAPLALSDVVAKLGALRNPEHAELMGKVLRGESFAAPGERDTTLQRVASMIAFAGMDNDPMELASLLVPSLSQMANEAPDAPTVEDAIKKIERAQRDAVRERQEEAEQDAGIRRALDRRARGMDPGPGGIYSDEDIAEFARMQGCSPDSFTHRWVIQYGNSYYVFCNGTYSSAVPESALKIIMPQKLARAPIKWVKYTAKGDPVRRTMAEILPDCASVALKSLADLSLRRSHYDAETETFHEAVCSLREDVEPTFHPLVDQWLRLLGGVDADKLLDWIATVTVLSLPSSALYLAGPPGSGKTMLANGLARLWASSPTELASVMAEFNSDLVRCPLVLADEHLPQTFKSKRNSAELRSLIANSSRTLRRKFQQDCELIGHIRLVLTANNERMLNLGDEDLSNQDLAAVGGRFMCITVPQAATDFLRHVGRAGTEGWVDRDIIAEHALWLKDNRQVMPGDRFIVEGANKQDILNDLVVQNRVPALVCEWIARHLDNPKNNIIRSPDVQVGNGRILVSTLALVENWMIYIKSDLVPTTTRVGRALGNLSKGDPVRIGNHRYHDINPDVIYRWAMKHAVGSVEEMRRHVETQRALDAEGNMGMPLDLATASEEYDA